MTAAVITNPGVKDDAWSQVSELRPRLKSNIEFHCHQYRGRDWYVVVDTLAAKHFRCTANAHDFLVLLDGKHTVAQAFFSVITRHENAPPDQDEIIRLLAWAREAGLLAGVASDGYDDSHGSNREKATQRIKQAFIRPLSIKFPLLDPDSFLRRFLPLVSPVFSAVGFFLWSLLVAWGALICLSYWPDLGVHWESRFLDMSNLLWLWLLYPVVKGLHELGHGFATRARGGEVHEMGVILLVFMPVPYVDASSSAAFPDKRHRMLVGGAGIMVELLISALALMAWVMLEPGFARDMAFNIAFIGGASTLLFNGNPLLRFDGYYVLADALEIPNLGTRSSQYLGYLIQRYVLRMRGTVSSVSARGERGWLFGYALAAGLYRLFITFTIALFVAGKFFVVGMAMAVWFLITQLIMPVVKIARRLVPVVVSQGLGLRLFGVTTSFVVICFAFLFVLPLPHSTSSSGIINLAEDASVRSEADGFIQEVLRENGERVSVGDPLFRLEDAGIDAKVALLRAKEAELQARYNAVMIADPNAAARFMDEISSATAARRDMEAQQDNLLVRSRIAGRFALSRAGDLRGRFVNKGDVLAHVVELSSVNARVVVPQEAVDLVRRHTELIEVKLYSEPDVTLRSSLLREVPSATDQLPSMTLGSQAGGGIAVDVRDKRGTKTIDQVFQFDIALPARETGGYLGQSLAVRFVHSNEPIGMRLLDKLRRLFLERKLPG